MSGCAASCKPPIHLFNPHLRSNSRLSEEANSTERRQVNLPGGGWGGSAKAPPTRERRPVLGHETVFSAAVVRFFLRRLAPNEELFIHLTGPRLIRRRAFTGDGGSFAPTSSGWITPSLPQPDLRQWTAPLGGKRGGGPAACSRLTKRNHSKPIVCFFYKKYTWTIYSVYRQKLWFYSEIELLNSSRVLGDLTPHSLHRSVRMTEQVKCT